LLSTDLSPRAAVSVMGTGHRREALSTTLWAVKRLYRCV